MKRCVLLSLLVTGALAAAPYPKFEGGKRPYRAHWGAYTVLAQQEPDPDRELMGVARLLDRRGREVRSVTDERLDDIRFVELNGKGLPELIVEMRSGGENCCTTEYVFTQDGGLRNLLVFEGNYGSIEEVRDLNRDGVRELIAYNDVLRGEFELPLAEPELALVLGWDGRRYRNLTARFPEKARALARRYQAELLKETKKPEPDMDTLRAAAVGFYANSRAIGEAAPSRAWLEKNAPPETWNWLSRNLTPLHVRLDSINRRISASQARDLPSPH